jgi:hypothetical protein
MKSFALAFVMAVIISAAMPAAAQESGPVRVRDRREVRAIAINGWGGYGLYSGYVGGFRRYPYHLGRGILYPSVAPRTVWVGNYYMEEGRPLGLDPNVYGDRAYYTAGTPAWPYHYEAGRDEAPPGKPAPKVDSEESIGEGRWQWRAADYAGALASFKKAVAADLESADARLHMALGLLAAGDLKNADKALASALQLERATDDIAGLAFDELFPKPRELRKFEAKLVPAKDGTGAMTVALAQYLLGVKAKAAATLEASKDPAAKKLTDAFEKLDAEK